VKVFFVVVSIVVCLGHVTLAGPYSNATAGIAATDSSIAGWATSVVELQRGPQDISVIGSPLATFGTAGDALGPASSAGVVSLGDGGAITLSFSDVLFDAQGPDFAVFENGFEFGGGLFAELAFVEVSSNGTDFVRFASVSLTPTDTQVGGFGVIDPTNVNNLAGKHISGFGTPFDLAELAGVSPLLDVSRVTMVRIVDVVGTINPLFGRSDSLGNVINDPYPTPFGSAGFDLNAVAAIHLVPEPCSAILVALAVVTPWRRSRAG
jgi:hypothetical protein